MIDPGFASLVCLVVALVWTSQFVPLMLMGDRSFPGAHDRPLWVAAFLLAFPVAPFAFLLWRHCVRNSVQGTDPWDKG